MQTKINRTFLLCGILFCFASAEARWASKDDAAFIRHLDRHEIYVKKDGTFSSEYEFEDEILKDSARRSAGSFRTGYNSNSTEFTVVEAKTINGSTAIPVEKKYIQDKPLASTGKGFDEIRQILIAFPKVDIGSRIRMKYKTETKQVPFEGFFSESVVFGSSHFAKKKVVRIRSELPLIIKKHDPEKYLSISRWKKKGIYHLKIELRRPIYKRIVDEELASIDGSFYPWVDIATTNKWDKMIASVIDQYDAIISKEIPDSYTDLLKEAKKIPNGPKQINYVTSQMAKRIHYMGDWRPINGGHVPRPLATIAETGFGDCKDMSSLLTAILRKLGYTANVAFIYRSWNPIFSPTNLPRILAFNHAVVHAKEGNKSYWLDPTNTVSFANGIFEDIIDRPALIVDKENSRLVKVPAGVAQGSVIEAKTTVTIRPKK